MDSEQSGLARAMDEPDDLSDDSSSYSMTTRAGRSRKTPVLTVGMEIDPMKMDEASDPKVNTLQLWLTAQMIFSSITRSVPDMPQELAYAFALSQNDPHPRLSGIFSCLFTER